METNFNTREVNIKIVYYGPGLSGKTTNLEVIHARTPEDNRGKLSAVATDQDRTLFFDYMPLELGEICGLKVRLKLFTVPGQVYYNATRKLVLRCVDGVIFVADSQEDKKAENQESLQNLRDNLAELNYRLEDIALVMQFNKRDLPNTMPLEVMESLLNKDLKAPWFPAVAVKGDGVFQCIKSIANMTLTKVEDSLKKRPKANIKPTEAMPMVASEREKRATGSFVGMQPTKSSNVEASKGTPMPVASKFKAFSDPRSRVEEEPKKPPSFMNRPMGSSGQGLSNPQPMHTAEPKVPRFSAGIFAGGTKTNMPAVGHTPNPVTGNVASHRPAELPASKLDPKTPFPAKPKVPASYSDQQASHEIQTPFGVRSKFASAFAANPVVEPEKNVPASHSSAVAHEQNPKPALKRFGMDKSGFPGENQRMAFTPPFGMTNQAGTLGMPPLSSGMKAMPEEKPPIFPLGSVPGSQLNSPASIDQKAGEGKKNMALGTLFQGSLSDSGPNQQINIAPGEAKTKVPSSAALSNSKIDSPTPAQAFMQSKQRESGPVETGIPLPSQPPMAMILNQSSTDSPMEDDSKIIKAQLKGMKKYKQMMGEEP